MDRPVRIGVAGLEDRSVLDQLRALPTRPDTHALESVYDETEQLVAYRPDVLFLAPETDSRDLTGTIRLLRGMLPGLPVVVVAPAAREVELQPLCARTAANLLLTPALNLDLEQALEFIDDDELVEITPESTQQS